MSKMLFGDSRSILFPKKFLCLVSNPAQLQGMEVRFFAEEMTRLFFRLINTGYEVDVASPRGRKVVFDGHSNQENPKGPYPNGLISIGFMHHKTFGKWMDNTIPVAHINVADYDAICVAGGGCSANYL